MFPFHSFVFFFALDFYTHAMFECIENDHWKCIQNCVYGWLLSWFSIAENLLEAILRCSSTCAQQFSSLRSAEQRRRNLRIIDHLKYIHICTFFLLQRNIRLTYFTHRYLLRVKIYEISQENGQECWRKITKTFPVVSKVNFKVDFIKKKYVDFRELKKRWISCVTVQYKVEQ